MDLTKTINTDAECLTLIIKPFKTRTKILFRILDILLDIELMICYILLTEKYNTGGYFRRV